MFYSSISLVRVTSSRYEPPGLIRQASRAESNSMLKVETFLCFSLFSDLRSLAGTTLMNLLAALFMVQLLFIVGVGGVQVRQRQNHCLLYETSSRIIGGSGASSVELARRRRTYFYSIHRNLKEKGKSGTKELTGSGCSQDAELCISLGLSLQYLRMTVVCWLAAMCHHLYATVASVPRRDDPPTYLKYSLFAWGAPFLNLAVAAFLQIREATDIWNISDLTPYNCWFLGTKATIYSYGLPVALLLLSAGYYLIKAAIVSRYTCSMQLEIKQREKMKRRRALQMILFLKVCTIVGLVAGCGVASRVWKVPLLWAIFCTGHSLQISLEDVHACYTPSFYDLEFDCVADVASGSEIKADKRELPAGFSSGVRENEIHDSESRSMQFPALSAILGLYSADETEAIKFEV
ncbi:hypothetical protein WN48_10300 [Eufriesea mexicana]|uniref:G-protein coupled receptors family 2 profile 2 domain-containing protein n=1 Tax=Eufriesea mexicana TaxID=516756 RepID=A0A310SSJ3_9HYME|nr:hypothetical protein WN48_10300 [Eufriesea mexicana]